MMQKERLSDVILLRLNRVNEGKYNGGIKNTEFADELELTGSLLANSIKLGKLSNDDIESVQNYLSTFVGPNKDKYISYPHQDYDKAAMKALQSIALAQQVTLVNQDQTEYSKSYIRS